MRAVIPLLVGLAILLATPGSAQARTRFINTEDQIVDLGAVPEALAPIAAGGNYDRVGFYYKRIAILGADVWSWSGVFVLYRQTPHVELRGYRTIETTYYEEVPEEVADDLGWRVPIDYRIPIGALIGACLIELAIVARKKRRASLVLAIGVGLVALSSVLLLLGMSWPVAIPLLVGLFQITLALPFFHPATNAEAAAAMGAREASSAPDAPVAPRPERRSEPALPPPPSFEKDPFRAPPQPPPIVVHRPETAPVAPPVVHDASAGAPKLLR